MVIDTYYKKPEQARKQLHKRPIPSYGILQTIFTYLGIYHNIT